MSRHRRAVPSALATGLALLLTAGCANSIATSPTAGASGGSVSPPQAPAQHRPGPRPSPEPAPTAAPANRDLQQVATRYLAARENAISYTQPTTRSWLEAVRPLMTTAGWQRLAATLGDDGGYPAATARQHHWAVRVTVSCRHNPDTGPATATSATVTCQVTDRTVGAAGTPVPVKDLPALWPYTGSQPPALLALHRQAGQWLVATDQTGQAG